MKWKPEILSDLDTLEGTLDIAMKPVQRGSVSVNVPFVTVTDAQGAKVEKTLEDYVAEKRPAYLPALRVDAALPPRGGNAPGPVPHGAPGVNDEDAKNAHRQTVGYG